MRHGWLKLATSGLATEKPPNQAGLATAPRRIPQHRSHRRSRDSPHPRESNNWHKRPQERRTLTPPNCCATSFTGSLSTPRRQQREGIRVQRQFGRRKCRGGGQGFGIHSIGGAPGAGMAGNHAGMQRANAPGAQMAGNAGLGGGPQAGGLLQQRAQGGQGGVGAFGIVRPGLPSPGPMGGVNTMGPGPKVASMYMKYAMPMMTPGPGGLQPQPGLTANQPPPPGPTMPGQVPAGPGQPQPGGGAPTAAGAQPAQPGAQPGGRTQRARESWQHNRTATR